jgi:hypothetical protein
MLKFDYKVTGPREPKSGKPEDGTTKEQNKKNRTRQNPPASKGPGLLATKSEPNKANSQLNLENPNLEIPRLKDTIRPKASHPKRDPGSGHLTRRWERLGKRSLNSIVDVQLHDAGWSWGATKSAGRSGLDGTWKVSLGIFCGASHGLWISFFVHPLPDLFLFAQNKGEAFVLWPFDLFRGPRPLQHPLKDNDDKNIKHWPNGIHFLDLEFRIKISYCVI